MKENKLSKKAFELITDFSEDAKYWGWQEDQGSNFKTIQTAERNYNESKSALEKYVLKLEKRIKVLMKSKEQT